MKYTEWSKKKAVEKLESLGFSKEAINALAPYSWHRAGKIDNVYFTSDPNEVIQYTFNTIRHRLLPHNAIRPVTSVSLMWVFGELDFDVDEENIFLVDVDYGDGEIEVLLVCYKGG